jgi:hypothetical protein
MSIPRRPSVHTAVLLILVALAAGCGGGGSDSATPPAEPLAETSVGIYDVMVVEGAGNLEFIVSLSSASTDAVTVDYETVDDTAIEGSDYESASGTLQFQPGELRQSIVVPVLSNSSSQAESSKHLQLILSNQVNAEISRAAGVGTIIDSDSISTVSSYSANWLREGVFQGANDCVNCNESDTIMQYDNPHVDLSTDDASSNGQWRHTVMAHAANDPYWQAAVQDESETFPHLAGLIEDTCTTCHEPMGRTHAHHVNSDPDFNYRFETAMSEDHAREGVSCVVCHLIEDSNMGQESSFSGNFIILDSPQNDKTLYGPYDAPFRGDVMLNNTIYDPQPGAHISSSELCATCHTLYTPAIDPETGAPSGVVFLEQGPYLEWQNSDYSTGKVGEKQCQDCHMPEPEPGYSTKITNMPGGAPTRTPYGQHTLVGGNAHLLEMLKTYSNELGISSTTTADGFDDQIKLTRYFLENSAAEVEVSSDVDDDTLNIDVDVTNNAGHKIPSAYPSRRAWLHVTVRDGSNSIIFESGKPDYRGYISTDVARLKADCMSAEKLGGFDSAACYEPHRDVISSPEQVAIYETVLADVHGEITHTLLKAGQYLKDNRIPPKGFTNSAADAIESQTIPVGVSDDSDFNCIDSAEGCGADTVHYQVDVDGQTGPYYVEARLLYQATQPAFVDGLHIDGDRVNRFKVMYDAVPPSVEILGIDTQSNIN